MAESFCFTSGGIARWNPLGWARPELRIAFGGLVVQGNLGRLKNPSTDSSLKSCSRVQAQDLQAVVAAWQSGAISQDTMFELFRKGKILADGRTNQDASCADWGKSQNRGRGILNHG